MHDVTQTAREEEEGKETISAGEQSGGGGGTLQGAPGEGGRAEEEDRTRKGKEGTLTD